MNTHSIKILENFAKHKVAANILMLIMMLSGFYALSKLNIQFFPDFEIEVVTVTVNWEGATSEDIERSIIRPLEQELRGINYLKDLYSTSKEGVGIVFIEFLPNTDMSNAMDDVKDRVALVRNLPETSEPPEIVREIYYEEVAKLLITSGSDLSSIRSYVYKFEQELLAAGISKIRIEGLPDEEIAIEIPMRQITELKRSLYEIGQEINKHSQDIPAGNFNEDIASEQIRGLNQRRNNMEFGNIALFTDNSGRTLRLSDIAEIKQRPIDDETLIFYQNKPVVVFTLLRTKNTDSIAAANAYKTWLEKTRPNLPKSINIVVFDERWQLIKERMILLLKNGFSGLILLVGILFIFLNRHLAFWTALGIPVSFLATLGILYVLGGSINMISMFALIMALGIIVDDAIVVGEESLTKFEQGYDVESSVLIGANRMLPPVLASSLTTISAFIPLMMVTGLMGTFLIELPIVVICVILASLIESFFVLPGHLYHSFANINRNKKSNFRLNVDAKFDYFKNKIFKPLLTILIHNPLITLSSTIGILVIAFSLIINGYIKFNFFPSPESTTISIDIQFAAGTPQKTSLQFLRELEKTAYETQKQIGEKIIHTLIQKQNTATFIEGQIQTGKNFASVFIETVSPENRNTINNEFIDQWKKNILFPPEVENINFTASRAGPPGGDIDILLSGQGVNELKIASKEFKEILNKIPGVYNIKDDIPYGQLQRIFTISDRGQALGLTPFDVANQIRSAFDGYLVQIFNQEDDEIEVKVILAEKERNNTSTLDELPIVTPNRTIEPLGNIVNWRKQRGIDILRHHSASLAINVTADVDTRINNTNEILEVLLKKDLPDLAIRHGLEYNIKGRSQDEQETLADMKNGALFALILIYLIMCWVFSSYGKPLIVLLAIPFGLCGAIFGHLVMGLELTLLSIFGMFGLSGIVINDGIILILFYQQIKLEYDSNEKAIIAAACQRLRAVILTTLTTIAGLTPLLFERSLQAQFLIPMATAICFGLAFGTILILMVIPTIVIIYENISLNIKLLNATIRLKLIKFAATLKNKHK